MQDYSFTKHRIIQWMGILLALGIIAVSYWYFNARAGVKTNVSLTDPLSEGLAGYWKLDEGSGTIATDSSTNGNNGTVPNSWTTGRIGSAVSFDGTTSMVVAAGTGVLDAKQNVTLSAWVYPRSTGLYRAWFYKGVGGCDEGTAKYMLENDVSGTLRFWMGGSSLVSSYALTTNQWQHIVATNSASGAAMYVNGVLIASGSGMAAPASSSEDWSFNRCNRIDANMDEIRIYDRSLTAGEIAQLYQLASPSGTDTSLKGYWSFNGKDISGTTAYDRSGAGNNGTLTNGPTVTPGKVGQALNFFPNGSDANTYVTMGDPTSGSLDFGSGDFSIGFWMKGRGYSSQGSSANLAISKQGLDAGTQSAGYSFYYTSSNLLIFNVGNGTTGYAATQTVSTVSDNQWHYYTGLRSGNTIYLYVDSNLVASTAVTGSVSTSTAFSIAGDTGNNRNANADIDEVRIYNTALSAAQIQSLYKLGQSDETNTGASQPQGTGRIDSGLAGYWKLDDGSGTSATDSSTNGNTGTMTGSPAWTTGQIGGAVDFDGVDDVINAGSNSSLDDVTTKTVAAWIKPDSLGENSNGYILRKIGAGLSNGWVLMLCNSGPADCPSTANTITLLQTAGARWYMPANSVSFSGSWIHVVFTYNSSSTTNDPVFYINGSLVTTSEASAPSPITSDASADLLIGNSANGDRTFDGAIDEVRMYNRILSANEVAELYRLTTPTGTDTSLKGYWSFNGKDISGTTAYDRSGAGNNGTLTNGPTVTPGKVGQALSFDGTNNVGIPNINLANQSLSITFWAKKSNNVSTAIAGIGNGGNNLAIQVNLSTTGFSCGFYASATSATISTDASWHHWACTYDASSNTRGIYRDGVLLASEVIATDYSGGSNTFYFGRDGYGNLFTGQIDEARLYNTALTATQIQALYKAGESDEVNTGASQPQGGSRLDSGLAGYWKLDDGSGTSATDSSTNGNTGTLTNGPTWTTGQIGGAVDFDGTDDYITAGSPTTLDNLSTMTLVAWIKPTSESGFRGILDKQNDNGNGWQFGICHSGNSSICASTNKIYFGQSFSNHAVQATWTSAPSSLSYGQWQQVAVTYNKSSVSNDPVFYINGVVSATTETTAPSGAADSDAVSTFLIGSDSAARTLYGSMDEVRAYNRILSADEIAQLYRLSSPTGTDTSLKGYWSFNGKDISGTTAYDRSGAGNNGTLTNGPTVTPGKVGQALSFDGSNDYVRTTMFSGVPTSTLTICAWAKPTLTMGAGDKYYFIAQQGRNSGDSDTEYMFYIYTNGTGTTTIRFDDYDAGNGFSTQSNNLISSLTSGNWHYVCFAKNGLNGTYYFNGAAAGTATAAKNATYSSNDFVIGADYMGANYFNGAIDEVRVYNTALTAAQVQALYNAGK